ncbi:MAG: filamentous hemagglutinin N-terminal domain-containing protein, partial [Rhizobiaceae bacterium]|nr:filamentous hemagglutinin N-terminal domain-containing protein [Rhizobiaceae bacterium]
MPGHFRQRRVVGHKLLFMLMSCTALTAPHPLFAGDVLPTGGQFTSGAGNIVQQGHGLTINQTSGTGIVQWNGFSIGGGNFVHFDNGSGATLNRVTGNLPSQIDGSLTATGSLYLINPAGIVVGNKGRVGTGGDFFASTHDLSDADFNAQGNKLFSGASKAAVVNLGTISSVGGDVALIARSVDNEGSVTAPAGTVGLLAGYEVLAKDKADSDGLFSVKVGGGDTKVVNSGTVAAANAELRANGGNVYALAGNTNGVVKATGVATQNGRVFLTAGDEGKVEVTGKVSATRTVSASNIPTRVPIPTSRPTGDGGDIRISGGTVTINGAVDASGADGKGGTVVATGKSVALGAAAMVDVSGLTGGTALIGGDYQGGHDAATKFLAEQVATADTATVASGATIRADGTAGAGGDVVVWSNDLTSFAGTISATGAGSAAGGDAEVSGKAVLDYTGFADLRSQNGSFGTLLLDPHNLTISTATSSGMSGFDANADNSVLNVSTLTTQLGSASVTVTTGSSGSQTGNITVAAPLSWSASSILTLNAAGSIAINADITATGSGAGLALVSGSGYSLNDGARVTLSGSAAGLSVNGVSYTLINSLSELQSVSTSGNYALATDIDASDTATWNGGAGFVPLPTFSGVFTGLGHAIDKLTIDRPTQTETGLFGAVSGSTVRDLTLSNVDITGAARVGALVGNADSASLSNIHVTGSVTASQEVG